MRLACAYTGRTKPRGPRGARAAGARCGGTARAIRFRTDSGVLERPVPFHSLMAPGNVVLVCALLALACWCAENGAAALGGDPGGCCRPADVDWVPTLGTRPRVRGAPHIVKAGDQAVLFGGFLECFFADSCDNFFYNDTFVLDLGAEPFTWAQVNTSVHPPPRAFFGAEYWPGGNKIVLFGGVLYSATLSVFVVYDDVWLYDVASRTYAQAVYPAGTGPGQRVGITLAVFGNVFIFFGGFDHTFTGHNDMWKFDLVAHQWTRLLADSSAPSAPAGRYLYSAVLDDDQRYWLFGGSTVDNGVDFATTNDTWFYDIAANAFVLVFSTANATNGGRTHGAPVFYQDVFYVFQGTESADTGGDECFAVSLAGFQSPTNTVIFLDTADLQAGWRYANLGVNTVGQKRVAGFRMMKTFLWGFGFGFQCPSADSSIPVWNPYLWSADLKKVARS
jgi:hypothetical protein